MRLYTLQYSTAKLNLLNSLNKWQKMKFTDRAQYETNVLVLYVFYST